MIGGEAALGISLRAETADDLDFLRGLYFSVRRDEFAALNWPEEVLRGFLAGQFQIQSGQYAATYPTMERWIVESCGAPVGRIYILRAHNELRAIDISLLPASRNHGIGTALLSQLCREADLSGLPFRLHVEGRNPALRLYRRLGFIEKDDSGVYRAMERPPRPDVRIDNLPEFPPNPKQSLLS